MFFLHLPESACARGCDAEGSSQTPLLSPPGYQLQRTSLSQNPPPPASEAPGGAVNAPSRAPGALGTSVDELRRWAPRPRS